jgi:hypothetical protein
LPMRLWLPSRSLILSYFLLLQHLSRGSVNVPMMRAEETRAQEVNTVVEAAHVKAVLAAETFAQEAATARDHVTTLVKDAEVRAALAERGA